jgi:hypothetical protein
VWHVASEKGPLEILHKLWEWGKVILTQEKLNYMFLAKKETEMTAWHIALEQVQIEGLVIEVLGI